MKNICFVLFLIIAPLIFSASAAGHGINLSESFLENGNEAHVLDIPSVEFDSSVRKILGVSKPAPETGPYISPWQKTLNADCDDLRAALAAIQSASIDERVEQYSQMRSQMNDFYNKEYSEFSLKNRAPRELYNLGSNQSILDKLPPEFSLYVKGANAYHSNRFEEASAIFESLLQLPPEQRRFRSVWATFMLGKLYLYDAPDKSIGYFERTRELSLQGYSDLLHLTVDSQGWQAMAEWQIEKFRVAFLRYLNVYRGGPTDTSLSSLIMICKRIAAMNPIPEEIVRESCCRKIVTAWLLSGGSPSCVLPWRSVVQNANLTFEPAEGEQLAWLAYQSGDFELTQKWLPSQESFSPIGYWVQSKLDLRAGKIEEAVAALRKIRDQFPNDENKLASAELGVLKLGRQEYAEALDAFARAVYWSDSAYVAERVLTIDELKKYVKSHQNDPILNRQQQLWFSQRQFTTLENLRYLLARRLVRENRWKEAMEYFPDSIRPLFDQYAFYSRKSFDKKFSSHERAENFFAAGKLLRESGMEIMGTESDPDWRMSDGQFDPVGPVEVRAQGKTDRLPETPISLRQALSASDSEKKRSQKNAPNPNRRFHYRPLAISLLWESAKLLPDNDPLTARVLYTGWLYSMQDERYSVKNDSDRFYKTLVRRCRKLPIGEAAYQEHWIPHNAKDLLDPDHF